MIMYIASTLIRRSRNKHHATWFERSMKVFKHLNIFKYVLHYINGKHKIVCRCIGKSGEVSVSKTYIFSANLFEKIITISNLFLFYINAPYFPAGVFRRHIKIILPESRSCIKYHCIFRCCGCPLFNFATDVPRP